MVRPKLDPTSAAFADRLDDLIDLAEHGPVLARDWQELGWHLAAAPMVHLRRGTWEILAQRLIGQLPRSIKVCYRQLSTAAMNMAAVPRAQDFMAEAIAQYTSVPGVQVITSPVGLLDRLPHPAGRPPGAGDHRPAGERPHLRHRDLAGHPEDRPRVTSTRPSAPSSTC